MSYRERDLNLQKLEASDSRVALRLLGLVFEDDEERDIGFLSEKIYGEVLSQDDYSARQVVFKSCTISK